jgi:signal transduction histidine kinase
MSTEAAEMDALRRKLAGLRASQRRLVLAADIDRRRLERALHDGLQQDLVALAANIQLASAMIDRDPSSAGQSLADAAMTIRHAIDEAAALAQAIYPALLEARGLANALRSLAAGLGLSASIVVTHADGQPPDLVTAIYWCCSEALAAAPAGTHASISVSATETSLAFEVEIGAAYDAERLERMRDRVEALGGRLTSPPAGETGSVVAGWLALTG